MPRLKLTKSTIDVLPTPAKDIVYWDSGCPGFGVKITPKGRKVFIVLYRAGGAGSRLRKYTIGPYGRVTLHQARTTALKIFAARTEGRDPAAEKQQARRRLVVDRVEDLVELFITEHVSKIRSAREISRLLRREVIPSWGARSIHDIGKRQVIELVTEVAARGTPSAANKLLKMIKAFFGWCVGRAILDVSPANELTAPAREKARDRVLGDNELARVLLAARRIGYPYWRLHDLRRTCVSGMARLGVAPHVADNVLNHQAGTISGVAAVYQRHEFLGERKDALERWGAHIVDLLKSEERLVA
jgi:integrase